MGWFGRKKEELEDVELQATPEMAPEHVDITPDMEEKAQEVMADNMEVMRDIVFRIREDPEFAKGIYKNCPRLQALLAENPDLRPIFEDPKLVKINFEKVYRDNGGILPEDDPPKEPWVVTKWYYSVMEKWSMIKSHPMFKAFKIAMKVKKIMGYLSPTKGLSIIKGGFSSWFEHTPDLPEGPPENPQNALMKAQLNGAADHMEDPEVQEKMQALMADPDSMEASIDNDPQLSALRDQNPLCAELMKDPDTMKILVDPDNLRALGECPDLIQADFADPDGFQYEVPDASPELDTIPEGDIDVPEAGDPVDGGNGQNLDNKVMNQLDDVKAEKKQTSQDPNDPESHDYSEAAGFMGAFGGLAGALGVDFSALNPGINFSDLNPGIGVPDLTDTGIEVPSEGIGLEGSGMEGVGVEGVGVEGVGVEGVGVEGVGVEGMEGLTPEEMPEGEIPEGEMPEEGVEDEKTTLQDRLQEEMTGEENNGGSGDSKSKSQQRAANTSSDPNAPQEQSTFGSLMGGARDMLLGAIGGVAAGYAQDMAFGEATSMLSIDNANKIQEFQSALEREDEANVDEHDDDNGRNQRGVPPGDSSRDAGAPLNPDGTLAVGQEDTKPSSSGRFAFVVTVASAVSTVVKDNMLKAVANRVLGEDAADALFTGMEVFEEEDGENDNNDKDEKDDNNRSLAARDTSQSTVPSASASPTVPSGSEGGDMWADFGTK
jgi:hypothetical protein